MRSLATLMGIPLASMMVAFVCRRRYRWRARRRRV